MLIECASQYLRNHGIPQDEIDKTYAESAKFFALPTDVKEPLAWKGASRSPPNPTTAADHEPPLSQTRARTEAGLLMDESVSPSQPTQARHSSSRMGANDHLTDVFFSDADEIAKLRLSQPDFKESMEVGRERDPGDVEPLWKNEWPPAGVVRTPDASEAETLASDLHSTSSTRTSRRFFASSTTMTSCKPR